MTNKLFSSLVFNTGIHLFGCTSDNLMYSVADSFNGDYNVYRDSLLKFDSIIIWRKLSQIVDAIVGQRTLNHTKQHVFLYNLTYISVDEMEESNVLIGKLVDFCKETNSIIIFIFKAETSDNVRYTKLPALIKSSSNAVFCGGSVENMGIDVVKRKANDNFSALSWITREEGFIFPILEGRSLYSIEERELKVNPKYLQRIGRGLRTGIKTEINIPEVNTTENITENHGCYACKHYNSKFRFDSNDKLYSVKECKIGNTEACLQWWENNGKKSSSDTCDSMSCFEKTEINSLLDKANESATNIIKLLNLANEKKTAQLLAEEADLIIYPERPIAEMPAKEQKEAYRTITKKSKL